MNNIAAIRWLPRGKYKPPIIQYMLLDPELEYLIYPKEIEVTHLKTNLKEIFNSIAKAADNGMPLIIHYKSVSLGYRKHRRDSAQFHHDINKILKKRKLLKPNARTAVLLQQENLKLFKNALYLLDVDCKARGCAFIAHLWAIALKATAKRVPDVIKRIWKVRCHIKRMNTEANKNFLEFYRHLI
ncbi:MULTISPECIES: hypothetical protein [Legionella]|nr:MULTISPECIES: hypothetical protein [Legionella]MCP0914181.1 hypothetical protein [Legionella sp. 27cVA30]